MSDTAKVIPINKVREPLTGHLNNCLQIVQCSMEQLPHMSEQAIAATAPADIVAMRDRVQAAVDILEEAKELLANLQTPSDRFRAIRKIRSLL